MPGETSAGLQDGIQAQVLIELGKVSTSLAVANTKLDGLIAGREDHEQRIRAGETDRSELHRLLGEARAARGAARDLWSRFIAAVALLAAVASTAASYLHR